MAIINPFGDDGTFILPQTPNKNKNDVFQAGVGCGDDLHLNSLIGESGFPLFHDGYFYLPNYEYFLAGEKVTEYVVPVYDEVTNYAYAKIEDSKLPNEDLYPQIFISGEY